MKMAKITFYIFLSLSVLTCSKAEKSDLTLDMVNESSYLIPTDGQSCLNKMAVDLDPAETEMTYDVSSRYFSYNGATLSWANTENTAYIVGMKFEFTGKNLEFSCMVAGEELLAVFYDKDTNTQWDGSIAQADNAETPRTKTSLCTIRCGGVTIPDGASPFSVRGKVTLIGFERTPSGEEKPLKTSSYVKLIYE
jgi:hypothetical protein